MSDMKQRKDRRFKQWSKTTIKALAEAQKPAGPAEAEGFTYEISLGGARVHSWEPFAVVTRLRLQIELVRTREILNVEGRVKWIKHHEADKVYEMGVEFHHSNSQTITSLLKNFHDACVEDDR